MNSATTLATLSSQGAADKLAVQVKTAVTGGATAETLGEKVPAKGAFFQPTILAAMDSTNPSYYEEFFGPVSIIIRVKDEAEAIAVANDSPIGLGGSVFTRDTVRGEKVIHIVDINAAF